MNEITLRAIIREELIALGQRELPVLLTLGETSKLLKISEGTLANWRSKGIGPIYIKLNGAVRYDKGQLVDYIRSKQ